MGLLGEFAGSLEHDVINVAASNTATTATAVRVFGCLIRPPGVRFLLIPK